MILITMGEPAGIGAEIAQKAWHALRDTGPAFALIDDATRLHDAPIQRIATLAEARFAKALPVLHCPLAVPSTPGTLDIANAPMVIAAIEDAVALCRSGQASALVTNPIQKSVLTAAGFRHPGHTEFLGELAGTGRAPVMMLTCPDVSPTLRSIPITIHLSLRRALDRLTTALIIETAETTAEALRRDFGMANPRLAFSGLNPHAGEDGTMGDEEIRLIRPALDALRARGIDARGPYPADTLFTPKARAKYDAALSMTHDQALIPVKTLDMDGGVNVTLGLSIIRTSPDHGTALDIAGKGIADPGSLIAAIRYAAAMAASRNICVSP